MGFALSRELTEDLTQIPSRDSQAIRRDWRHTTTLRQPSERFSPRHDWRPAIGVRLALPDHHPRPGRDAEYRLGTGGMGRISGTLPLNPMGQLGGLSTQEAWGGTRPVHGLHQDRREGGAAARNKASRSDPLRFRVASYRVKPEARPARGSSQSRTRSGRPRRLAGPSRSPCG
jgi:hypothetical protein